MRHWLPLALTALLVSPAFAEDDKAKGGPPAETPSGTQPAIPGERPAIPGNRDEVKEHKDGKVKHRHGRKNGELRKRGRRHGEGRENPGWGDGSGGGKDHPKGERPNDRGGRGRKNK